MAYDFNELIKVPGNTVDFNGKLLAMTQDAFISGRNDDPYYIAHAIDKDGNDYDIKWEVLKGWQDIENEDEMCDWSKYTVEER